MKINLKTKNITKKFLYLLAGGIFLIKSESLNATFSMSTLSPIVNYLRPIELSEVSSGIDPIDCIYVINLTERPEKWRRVKIAFDEQNLHINRVPAINGWKLPSWKKLKLFGSQQIRLYGGEIGCFLSHVSIYQDAVDRGFGVVWICEDDVEFKTNADKLSALINELSEFDKDWDILYTDYCTHGTNCQDPRPGQPNYEVLYIPISENLIRIHGRHRLHSVIFSKKGLQKVLNYFTHVYLWSPLDVDIHYVPGLREYSSARDIVTSVKDHVISDTPIGSTLNPVK